MLFDCEIDHTLVVNADGQLTVTVVWRNGERLNTQTSTSPRADSRVAAVTVLERQGTEGLDAAAEMLRGKGYRVEAVDRRSSFVTVVRNGVASALPMVEGMLRNLQAARASATTDHAMAFLDSEIRSLSELCVRMRVASTAETTGVR